MSLSSSWKQNLWVNLLLPIKTQRETLKTAWTTKLQHKILQSQWNRPKDPTHPSSDWPGETLGTPPGWRERTGFPSSLPSTAGWMLMNRGWNPEEDRSALKNQRRRRNKKPIWTNQTVFTLTAAACAAEMSLRIFSPSVKAFRAVSLNSGGRLDGKPAGADRTKDANRKYCSIMRTEGRKQIGTLLVPNLSRNKTSNITIWQKSRTETKTQTYLILGVRYLISVDF